MGQGWKKEYTRYKGFFLNIVNLYNSKPNFRVYLELLLTLGTIILFSTLAIRPTVLTIIEIRNEISAKESTIQKLTKKTNDLQSASRVIQQESETLELINQSIPSQANLENLISQIERLAIQNNITITAITSSDLLIKGSDSKVKKQSDDLSPLPESANELPLSIAVSGDYPNLMLFLNSIEMLRRPIKIDTLILNSSKSQDEEVKKLTLTINGRSPYIIVNNNKDEKQ